MTHSQEYLDTLTKEQRGEIWIKSVLVKEPDYDVQELRSIWDETENTHETYEQEADKIKWVEDKLTESRKSGFIRYETFDDMVADINDMRQEVYAEYN